MEEAEDVGSTLYSEEGGGRGSCAQKEGLTPSTSLEGQRASVSVQGCEYLGGNKLRCSLLLLSSV